MSDLEGLIWVGYVIAIVVGVFAFYYLIRLAVRHAMLDVQRLSAGRPEATPPA